MLDKFQGAGCAMVPSAGSSWDKEWMCREEAHRSACPCGQDSLGQAPRVREWLMGAELWGTGAYAGRLPQALEEPLGRDEELEQAAEPIPLVAGLQQPKHLAQDGGSSGFEGRVEGLEGTLHRCIQRAGILRNEGKCRWWESGPAAGGPPHRAPRTVAPDPVPTIPRCTVPLSRLWDTHRGNAAELRVSKPSWAGNGGIREWSRASAVQAGRAARRVRFPAPDCA